MAFTGSSGLDALLKRPEQETFWTRFRKSPVRVIARTIYDRFSRADYPLSKLPNNQNEDQLTARVVCISDTHNTKPSLPDGDILIHAGDLTQSGTKKELEAQINWLHQQPHQLKVVIAGNHELCLDRHSSLYNHDTEGAGKEEPIDWKSLIYLQNTSVSLRLSETRSIKIFGSPYTPKHGNWAFQYERTNSNVWNDINIPEDTDILITHGPPRAHLDLGHLGCSSLLARLWKLQQKPKLHVFGHIHGAYGKETVFWDSFQRSYEYIMEDQAKVWNLAILAWFALVRYINGWSPSGREQTTMVNAAAVGGVHDEKRREAICVDIPVSRHPDNSKIK
ncbi:Metallo-dependent phosphatase-like protein [Aspergillus crustosus]